MFRAFLLFGGLLASGLHYFGPYLFENAEFLLSFLEQQLEQGNLPDWFVRYGIRTGLRVRLEELAQNRGQSEDELQAYVQSIKDDLWTRSIAEHTVDANVQHYEVDTSFYELVLGQRKKYSAGVFYPSSPMKNASDRSRLASEMPIQPLSLLKADPLESLTRSGKDALDLVVERARLCVGESCSMRVLDLGCGWGSFSLYYAELCPGCTITSMSNSASQITFINEQARKRGLTNIRAIVGNVNDVFDYDPATPDDLSDNNEDDDSPALEKGRVLNDDSQGKDGSEKTNLIRQETPFKPKSFDRVISIEMFEHMKNYGRLLSNIAKVLDKQGMLFVHMFVHWQVPYHFTLSNRSNDWMAQYFFTGGTMASFDLLPSMANDSAVQTRNRGYVLKTIDQWKVNGLHYSYTLELWMALQDLREPEVRLVLAEIYGLENVEIWWNRWRMFWMSCSELFRFNQGNEWFVGHYLFQKQQE